MATQTQPTNAQILNFTEEEAREFLRNNYGTNGVNKRGLTKKPENQTLENLRLECIFQNNYNQNL